MLEKYKKYPTRFDLEGKLFSSSVKNDTEKISMTTLGLLDAKYSLVNGKLYKTIGIINLNEIKKYSGWVNVNFQAPRDNRQTKHFANNFITKNAGDILDFTTRLIDDNNK